MQHPTHSNDSPCFMICISHTHSHLKTICQIKIMACLVDMPSQKECRVGNEARKTELLSKDHKIQFDYCLVSVARLMNCS
jgi:hypothetical protein